MSEFNFDDANKGIFNAGRTLDGEMSAEFVDKEQFIGLRVHSDEFLLPISSVEEIIMLPRITYVPQSTTFIEGVINLRGIIVPVVNIRKVLNHPRTEATSATRIIIVKEQNLRVGFVVDAITFVTAYLPEEISKDSLHAFSQMGDIFAGICKSGEKITGILDVVKLITIINGGTWPKDNEEEHEEKTGAA